MKWEGKGGALVVGRLTRARAWLPKANLVQHEAAGTLLIQAKDPVTAGVASQGDISTSAEKQLL